MYHLSEDPEITKILNAMRKEFENIVDEFFKENPDVLKKLKGEK